MCAIPSDPKVVGFNVKLLRAYRRLSREQLAAQVGVVSTTLARFEQGARLPRPRLLALIARVLGVPDHALVGPIELAFGGNDSQAKVR